MENIIYLPLDERFATRDTFLNLARLTPVQVLTPPRHLLPNQKKTVDLARLDHWLADQIKKSNIMILSAEMFLYGGLINSRLSFTTQKALQNRLSRLSTYQQENPDLKIYLSTVIMRIPAYSLALEEPDFWQWYGQEIFNYSFHTHRYQVRRAEKDQKIARQLKEKIPEKYLAEFLWRRERNHQLTKQLLKLQHQFKLCEAIYLTLDDNAAYGFNKQEEEILRDMVKNMEMEEQVNIYPGADEVALTVLARAAIDQRGVKPSFQVVYRDDAQQRLIPNYEGQSLSRSVEEQIKGSGAEISEEGDIILLVNNFSSQQQLEADRQTVAAGDDYRAFQKYTKRSEQVIALADVRYSNGGDLALLQWIKENFPSLHNISYAGWNTSGNTLGTVIANSILLYLYQNRTANQYFNTLRLLEDLVYQAQIRVELNNYIKQSPDSVYNLRDSLDFYQSFVRKRMEYEYSKLKERYQLPYQLKNVFFPWQRTFEIGIELEENDGTSDRN